MPGIRGRDGPLFVVNKKQTQIEKETKYRVTYLSGPPSDGRTIGGKKMHHIMARTSNSGPSIIPVPCLAAARQRTIKLLLLLFCGSGSLPGIQIHHSHGAAVVAVLVAVAVCCCLLLLLLVAALVDVLDAG